jgi:IS5 family transposase
VILQNYVITTDRQGREVVKRREADTDGLPPASLRVSSPYDVDARWAAKGDDLFWNGYKIHITETCDSQPATCGAQQPAGEKPNLVTNVATTPATVPDASMTEPIHAALAARDLLPGEHYVDSGYPSAALVVDSLRQYGITLVSPLLADHSPQARANGGHDRASFTIDFDAEQATCPQGQTSSWWTPASQRGTDVVVVKFAAATCRACPVRDQCTSSTSPRYGRQLTVPPREVHQAQTTARAAQNTKDWQARYAIRAGVEGTIRQGIAVTGMRRARYRGLAKTHLDHVYSAVALNMIRLDAWWNGHPLDRTRTSHLARLELALAA